MVIIPLLGQRLIPAAVMIAVLLVAMPSSAQITTPCNETIAKYCKDVVPGSGRIMKCLNDHREDQSIACKDWVEDQQKSMQELIAVCTEEIATLCKIDPPDKVRIYLCLLDNYIALKVDCRSKLGEIRDRLK